MGFSRLLTLAFVVLCIAAITMMPASAVAQTMWLPHTEANSISLEMYKVDWDGRIQDVSFASGAMFVTGRYSIGSRVALVGELPVSNFRQEGRVGPDLGWQTTIGRPADEWQTAFGNPYIGVVVHGGGKPGICEIGIRLPVVSEEDLEARTAGAVADIDRVDAWVTDLVTIRGRLGRFYSNAEGTVEGQTMIGGALAIPTGDGDKEFFLDLLGKVWFRNSRFRFGLEFAGRMWLTETGPDLDERLDIQFGAGITADYGNFRPGLHMHMPLGDEGLTNVGQVADMVFGLHVTAFL